MLKHKVSFIFEAQERIRTFKKMVNFITILKQAP